MYRNRPAGPPVDRHGYPQADRIGRYLVTACLAVQVAACVPGQPAPIRYGQDACSHCRMTIVDDRFSASLLTPKGRTLSFDAVECLVAYLNEHGTQEGDVIVVADYASPGTMADAATARYLRSDAINSPMGGGLASFARADSCETVRRRLGGTAGSWHELLEPQRP